MGGKGSAMNNLNPEISSLFLVFILVSAVPISRGGTNLADIAAINNLYAALGSPPLPGWFAVGGDPCADAWQGVQCENTHISSIILNGANLGGELGNSLGSFSSIKSIDLSNNEIGGSIPSNLPITMHNFFLADNKFTGSIPSSLSTLSQLSAMSLNNNQLTGEIPDAFQGLTGLVNLDLSSNNLSGQLPPSIKSLSLLTTLHLQDNRLSGTLAVLEDLPLRDLNVENNLFSGPIPEKLLRIPNFKKDGIPFSNSTALSPAPPSLTPVPPSLSPLLPPQTLPPWTMPPPAGPTTPFFGRAPPTVPTHRKPTGGPHATEESNSKSTKKVTNSRRIAWICIASVTSFIILALALLLCLPRCFRRRKEADRFSKRHEIAPYRGREESVGNGPFLLPGNQMERVTKTKKEQQTEPGKQYIIPKPRNEELNVRRMSDTTWQGSHEIDMSRFDIDAMPPPPPPSLPQALSPPVSLPFENLIVTPNAPAEVTAVKPSSKPLVLRTSVKPYTIASLQQYTNSFSQEYLIGLGMLGSVYRAELPNGKLLAVKKLDKKASNQQDDKFIDLVNSIDRIRHANVVELMGYCAEHGQTLLVYEYCRNGTLHDALHSDDEFKNKFSWKIRMRMALGAARALEYLHEICAPPVIHRNFKSANVLLDDEFAVHVSDCGLAALISPRTVSQLSGVLSTYGYGAPEFESGVYTSKSDVYSFGVVMLELLTGRQSYDRMRNRGEQYLVRWAIPQLHDIDALSRMVDPSLHGQYPVKSLSHFADIISRCVQPEPEFRPPMSEVVQDIIQMIRRESNIVSDG